MPLHQLFGNGQTRVALWKIEETTEELLSFLPIRLRERYEEEVRTGFKSVIRRNEWLAIRVLAHKVFDLSAPIAYKPTHAPFIPHTSAYISISHCPHLAALALSEHPVGIDLELEGPRALRIKSKFLTQEEAQTVFRTAPSITNDFAATAAWTAKEAAFKFFAHKTPLSLIQEAVITSFSESGCTLKASFSPLNTCRAQFHIFGNLICTLAE